jgi:hypothetical protein
MTKWDWIYSQYRKACKKSKPSLVGLYTKINYGFPLDNEIFEIIGERDSQIEVQGDFSAGTHNVCQSEWVDKVKIKQLFQLRPKLRR